MSERVNRPGGIDLRPIIAATAVVIGMVATAVVTYLLLDIFLLLFMGVVVAAALQPWHIALARWRVPKALAVLSIYLVLLVGIALIALVVGPLLIEQLSRFVAELPASYASARSYLESSGTAPFHFLGQRLPTFEHLTPALTGLAPQLYEGTLGVTTSLIKLPAAFVAVLAIAFYWTMEMPRFERLLLSLLTVEQRPRALNVWHEIEAKLGGFVRGQGLAMLFIGAASALGYAQIGLPNVLALGVLAGLLEAVPWIGPVLAVGPAILVALPLGPHSVFMVMGLAMVLQLIESNVLVPRIMHRTVGVSALVGLLAVLAFGTLYGILGIVIAIPMVAVFQVLIETLVLNSEPLATPAGLVGSPWDDLRARARALRQEARVRLRARTSRMGIHTATADHIVDAVDERIEVAVARVEKLIAAAEVTSEPLATETQAAIVERLRGATDQIEQAAEQVEKTLAATPETDGYVQEGAEPEAAIVASMDEATRRFTEVVQDAETLVVAAKVTHSSDES